MNSRILIIIIFLMTFVFFACSNSPRYRTGEPKKSGRKISLSTKRNHRKVIYGVSSFYAEDFHGKLTANGEVYDMYGLTAAHKTLPLNTIIRVTNLSNDKSIILRVNDRGPYIAGRVLDCSYGAALKLGFIVQGTTKVKIEIIEIGDNTYMKHRGG